MILIIQDFNWLSSTSIGYYLTNLVIEAQDATLDVEAANIQTLKKLFETLTFDEILIDSKVNAAKFTISAVYKLGRKLKSPADAEKHHQEMFSKIKDTLLKSLEKRFKFIEEIISLVLSRNG